jgi:glycosyltransferase involved in cell wall biosynthesis
MSARVSGVTIVKDGLALGYPFREAIRSLLPLVEELIVNVGQGEDGTWEAVHALDDARIRPFRSVWDPRARDGQALSEQTNLAFARCRGDWIVYLQADEVLHEEDLPALTEQLEHHGATSIEGLVFDYLHFYASPHVINDDWLSFYPRAVRAVRNGIGVASAGDAAGFVRRIGSRSRGLVKAPARARIFHYGWADAGGKYARARALSSLYHDRFASTPEDIFPADLTSHRHVRAFAGTHPEVVRRRVAESPRPAVGRPYRSPAWFRAWSRLLRAPRRHLSAARSFLPLSLTNLRWRVSDWRAADRWRNARWH